MTRFIHNAGLAGLPGPAKVRRIKGTPSADDLVERKFASSQFQVGLAAVGQFFVSVARVQQDLAFAGVVRQRAMLADGSLRARELVSLYLDRLERLNPALNAFVSVRADAALREADQAQQSLDAGDTRPLLGIPFGVKDEHDLAGEVTSLGTGATTRVASHDSEVVRILRAAGAIPLGKTTLPELGMHPFTESITWGVTRNPWDLARTPGGSSGGSAAAVAAGLVSFATAGDGGGSIRVPASCCNLFGLKVQRGRVSTMPYLESVGGLSVIGVLTRDIEDAALLYDLLADRVHGHRRCAGLGTSLQESATADPGRLRIGVAYRIGRSRSGGARSAQSRGSRRDRVARASVTQCRR